MMKFASICPKRSFILKLMRCSSLFTYEGLGTQISVIADDSQCDKLCQIIYYFQALGSLLVAYCMLHPRHVVTLASWVLVFDPTRFFMSFRT